MANCSNCGKKIGLIAAIASDYPINLCPACGEADRQERDKADREAKLEQAKREDQFNRAVKAVIVTSTPSVDGFYIKTYIGIESVEFVIGTGIFSELSSSVADVLGVRSSAFEEKLQQAKQAAMLTLKRRAVKQGANAIVGVDMDFAEFSGNRVALILNGTLAEIVRRPTKQL